MIFPQLTYDHEMDVLLQEDYTESMIRMQILKRPTEVYTGIQWTDWWWNYRPLTEVDIHDAAMHRELQGIAFTFYLPMRTQYSPSRGTLCAAWWEDLTQEELILLLVMVLERSQEERMPMRKSFLTDFIKGLTQYFLTGNTSSITSLIYVTRSRSSTHLTAKKREQQKLFSSQKTVVGLG